MDSPRTLGRRDGGRVRTGLFPDPPTGPRVPYSRPGLGRHFGKRGHDQEVPLLPAAQDPRIRRRPDDTLPANGPSKDSESNLRKRWTLLRSRDGPVGVGRCPES